MMDETVKPDPEMYGIVISDIVKFERTKKDIWKILTKVSTVLSILMVVLICVNLFSELVGSKDKSAITFGSILIALLSCGFFGFVTFLISFLFSLILSLGILGTIVKFLNKYDEYSKFKRHESAHVAWALKMDISWWKSLNGRQFEIEVANVYSRKGYFVEIKGGSGDKGIDLIAQLQSEILIIQCKAFAKQVGPSVIREHAGVMRSAPRNSLGVVVALGGFSTGAKQSATEFGIILVCLGDLLSMHSESRIRHEENKISILKAINKKQNLVLPAQLNEKNSHLIINSPKNETNKISFYNGSLMTCAVLAILIIIFTLVAGLIYHK